MAGHLLSTAEALALSPALQMIKSNNNCEPGIVAQRACLWEWWFTPVIPALRKSRQENCPHFQNQHGLQSKNLSENKICV